MSSKFSPLPVIKDFYKYYQSEKFIILYAPLILSLILAFFVKIDMNLINLLLVALSLFIGFLLNLMLMSFNLKDDSIPPIEVAGKLWYLSNVLEEYHITISFEILITIILVVIMLLTSLIYKNISILIPDLVWILKIILNFVLVYLLILFLIILFSVLKFGHVLLKYYIQN